MARRTESKRRPGLSSLMTRPRRTTRGALIGALLTASLAGACTATTDSAPPPATSSSAPATSSAPAPATSAAPYTGYPDSIAVLGHSQATGENTTPPRGEGITANSWATGTNPAVQSVYQRILAHNPRIEDRNLNYAQPSATIEMINQQAAAAAAGMHPDLVLVQSIDADIVCPATARDIAAYGKGVATVLETLETGSPASRVFMLTQYGSPQSYYAALTRSQQVDLGATMGEPGPCAFVDRQGRLVAKEVTRLERIIVAYEKEMARVCEGHPNCEHDRSAFSHVVDAPGDYTDDLNHLSIQGLARAADVAWTALQERGLAPAE